MNKKLRYTPWGWADHKTPVCRGVNFYSTPSHGGYKVSDKLNVIIPPYMRNDKGWYEEDCAWAIPFVVLKTTIPFDEVRYINAVNTMKMYFWKEYELFFKVTLAPGESYQKDRDTFLEEHSGDWLVISAIGDWHDVVPNGMVGVVATLGGVRSFPYKRYFLISKDEYQTRGNDPFVIDLKNHTEIEEF